MKYIALFVVAVTAVACTSRLTQDSSNAAKNELVITRLEARDSVIVVRSSPDGPTYSLESKTGSILIPEMTLEELRVHNPELHHYIQTMHATERWAGYEESQDDNASNLR